MAQLSKWFPFKFNRNKKTEDTGESTTKAPGPIARTSGWPAMTPMHQFMQGMFSDDFFRDPFAAFANSDRFFGDFSPARFDPNVDIVDEGKFVRVSAELPGMGKDDIKLEVHEGAMSIRGEKRHKEEKNEEGCYRTERYYGSFQRNIPLPLDIDTQHAEALFDKGVLTVRFPKTEGKSTSKTIEVK